MPGPTPGGWDSCGAWWVPGIGRYGDIIMHHALTIHSFSEHTFRVPIIKHCEINTKENEIDSKLIKSLH